MPDQIPELTPVSSTHLDAVGYDDSTQKLYVRWKDGQISAYDNVPPLIASDLQNAPSVGKAFNSMIRGKYQHQYVER